MEEYSPIQQVLAWHAQRYPLWQPQDIYKLLHQAAMGSEHAVPGREQVREHLEQELLNLPDGPSEQLIELIHPEGAIVRLNLRALMRQNLSPVVVLEAFLQTAEEFPGSLQYLEEYMTRALELVRDERFGTDMNELEAFFSRMKEEHYPAVHHSEVYVREYSPAYRVVANRLLPSTWRWKR